jgi:yecA family protein
MTQDWLPVVLGEVKEGDEPFETQEDLDRFLAVMLKFYQDAQHQLITKSILFSEEYIYSEDPELVKPLSQWCEGLLIGHDWLEDIWTESSVDIDLDDGSSLQDTLDAVLAIITLFADIPQGLAESEDPDTLKAKLAFAWEPLLSTALLEYAQIGHELRRLAEELAKLYARTGRNDPCPCGSGQKFKRCCMP